MKKKKKNHTCRAPGRLLFPPRHVSLSGVFSGAPEIPRAAPLLLWYTAPGALSHAWHVSAVFKPKKSDGKIWRGWRRSGIFPLFPLSLSPRASFGYDGESSRYSGEKNRSCLSAILTHSALEAATGKLKGKRNDRVTQSLQTEANIKHCHINSFHLEWVS